MEEEDVLEQDGSDNEDKGDDDGPKSEKIRSNNQRFDLTNSNS
jgi:hypothetical protein